MRSASVLPGTCGVGSGFLSEESGGIVDYVVDVEDISADTLVRDSPDATSTYVEAFYRIRSIALPADDTNRLIDSLVETMSARC